MAKISNVPASTASVSSAPSGGMSIAAGADYSAPDKSDGAYSTEDIVGLFDEKEEQNEAGTADAGADTSAENGDEAAQDVAGGEETHEADYPMPEGWEEAMWQGASAELRGKVDSMVKAHAEAIAAKEKAMQDAAAQHREQVMKANAEMQTSLGIMRRVVEGEFSGIDWAGLSKNDPALYVDLQHQYQQRMGAIQQMQQNVAAQSAQLAQAQAAEARQNMQAELAAALPKVKALVGAGFTNDGFRTDLVGYLQKAGVPMKAIGAMSRGYELELATKAMLYDKSFEARQAAAAKVAEAPKVQTPSGSASVDGDGARLKAARARLNKNPNSTAALAELFDAM